MKPIVQALLNKVIVSCQAYPDTPLYGPLFMKKMAESALLGGAFAIRACWPQDIRAIREVGDFPIIGLNKVWESGYENIFITPTFESAKEVIEAGSDIVALDCTYNQSRTREQLVELLNKIRQEYPHIAIMADCATYEECQFLDENNLVDILSTTLSKTNSNFGKPDIDLIRKIKKNLELPVNAEGRIWEKQDILDVLSAGADMVTIGTAITRPHLITKRFVETNNKYWGL